MTDSERETLPLTKEELYEIVSLRTGAFATRRQIRDFYRDDPAYEQKVIEVMIGDVELWINDLEKEGESFERKDIHRK